MSSGRPHRPPSYQRGRGHEPVTVAGSIRSLVAVSIARAPPRRDRVERRSYRRQARDALVTSRSAQATWRIPVSRLAAAPHRRAPNLAERPRRSPGSPAECHPRLHRQDGSILLTPVWHLFRHGSFYFQVPGGDRKIAMLEPRSALHHPCRRERASVPRDRGHRRGSPVDGRLRGARDRDRPAVCRGARPRCDASRLPAGGGVDRARSSRPRSEPGTTRTLRTSDRDAVLRR